MGKHGHEIPHNREVTPQTPPKSERLKAERVKARIDRRKAEQAHDDLIKNNHPEKGKFERISGLTPEKISTARKAISTALSVMHAPAYIKIFKERGIILESEDYYLAIAIEESNLNPLNDSVGKGLFQIKDKALAEVHKAFDLNFETKDIFSTVPQFQEKASRNNAIAGILYWHLCKDVFPKNIKIPKEDKDRAAAFAYQLDSGDFANLWQTLGAKDFNDFAIKLSAQLVQKFPKNFIQPKNGKDVLHDSTYKLNYTTYVYALNQLRGGTIKIGNGSYNAAKLADILHNSEIIQSLTHKQPDSFETIRFNQLLWSITEKFLFRCTNEYQLPYCRNQDLKNKDKIQKMMAIIIRYNNEIDNPDFEDFDDENDNAEMKLGSKVFLPSEEYVTNVLKEWGKDIEPMVPSPLSKKIPLYAGKEAARLAMKGNEPFEAGAEKPPMVHPRYIGGPKAGELINLNKPTASGPMPKAAVKNIVIHATEGISTSLYSAGKNWRDNPGKEAYGQNAHFTIRRDGTIEQILNLNVATSHAGMMRNPKDGKRAVWEGDGSPSLHSVGIEVENIPLPSSIRKGKVIIGVDKNAKVSSLGKDSKIYYTDKPPSQKAIDEGWKQAHEARDFSDAQYKSLRKLVNWLGAEFKLHKKDVVTHSMIAASKPGRFRKGDAPVVDWDRLGLPNNHLRVDPDVATGRVNANYEGFERNSKGKVMEMVTIDKHKRYQLIPVEVNGKTVYSYVPGERFGTAESVVAGVKAADKIWKAMEKQKVRPATLDLYGLTKDKTKKAIVDSRMSYANAVLKDLPKDCPKEVRENQVLLNVYYYGFDGKLHEGQLVTQKHLAQDLEDIFVLAYKIKFPFQKVIPISKYEGSDEKSMADNNTSSFNFRNIAGRDKVSNHGKGFAIDINPRQNPCISKDNGVSPPGCRYNPNVSGALNENHPLVKKFKDLGWRWGGNWKDPRDYQHFEREL